MPDRRPVLAKARRYLAKAGTLHWPLLIVALATLPLVNFGLKLVGYARLERWLATTSPTPRRSRPEAKAERVLDRTADAVDVAARRGAIYGTCLSRSLTLWWLLRWQGVSTTLNIGVRRATGIFEAHAWLEHAGRVINDRSDIGREFTPFDPEALAIRTRAEATGQHK